MSTAAPSPSLRSLFSELEQLFQSETEARVSTSVQAAERALAEHLNQSVRRLRQAAAFPDACAVFHINENMVGGERLRGAASEAAERFRDIRFDGAEAAAFAGAIDSQEPVVALCAAAEVSPAVVEAFGHAPGERAYLFPLTVDRTTVGMLYATGAVDSAALELLAQATAAILEARQRPIQWDRPPGLSRGPQPAPDLVRIEPASAAPTGPAPDWGQLSAADRQL